LEEKTSQKYTIEDVLRKLFIAIAGILLLFSIWGIYTSLNDLINIWIDYKYAPLYKTLLNLAILILSLYVLTQLIKSKQN
jgi:hypothetical protein